MQIATRDDIRERFAAWRGVHLFHFGMSSCSQKLRLYLRVKDIPWTGHPVDLSTHENYGPDFLAINPRGMVPVLVLDGQVHIDSNDIIGLLEDRFPDPCLIPPARRAEVESLMAEEDALHHDLRHVSFRFVHGRTGSTKTPELMQAYREATTIDGGPDAKKQAEIAFYERLARTGLDDETCRASLAKFRAAFDTFDAALTSHAFLTGPDLTVVDIAWFVYAYRLVLGGYPLGALHPNVHVWYERCLATAGWEREVAPPPALLEKIGANRAAAEAAGKTIADVMGLAR